VGSVVVALPVVVHHAGQQVAQHVALGQRTRVVGRVAAYLACTHSARQEEKASVEGRRTLDRVWEGGAIMSSDRQAAL
jgi:hypothetical protein